MTAAVLWRVLPWDAGARPGAPFSASFVPPTTGRGRFDLPSRVAAVLYLAETPEHAVAELLHPWRGRTIDARHLLRAGHPLAAVRVESPAVAVADLCRPEVLDRLGTAPDRVASRHRSVTQPIARLARDAGHDGLHWWSRFWGDWHTTVLFLAPRAEDAGSSGRMPAFGEPEPLSLNAPAVLEAARLLGIEVRAS